MTEHTDATWAAHVMARKCYDARHAIVDQIEAEIMNIEPDSIPVPVNHALDLIVALLRDLIRE